MIAPMIGLLVSGAVVSAAVLSARRSGRVQALVPAPAAKTSPNLFGPVSTWRRRNDRTRQVQRDMPMTVDLVRLGIESGLNITGALRYVMRYLPGPLADDIAGAMRQVDRGQRLVDALEELGRLGNGVDALTAVLVSGERYGAPLASSLALLARETRLDQERRAERAARRLSVQLLFPVAGFILPAFALLTVAPLLAGSIGTLASSFH